MQCVICHTHKIRKANDRHGVQTSDEKVLAPNVMIRIAGVVLSEDFRDNLNILCDSRINNRQDLDANCADKLAVYGALSLLLSNAGVKIEIPPIMGRCHDSKEHKSSH